MAAHAKGDGGRQNPQKIKLAGLSADFSPSLPEASVTKAEDGQVVQFGPVKADRQVVTEPSPESSAPAELESPLPDPAPRPESLAQRLDHALDQIRRLMLADRKRGPR